MRLVLALFLSLLLPSGPARAFGDCMDDGYLDAFIIGTPPKECHVIGPFPIVTARGRSQVRLLQTGTEFDPATPFAGYTEQLAVALGPAFDAIGTARPPAEISILLTPGTRTITVENHTSRVHGEEEAMIGVRECTVAFFKLDTTVPVEDFIFTLAHEIFHCAQEVSYPDQMSAGDGWWAEGSAEYFAHLTLPGYNTDNGFVRAFDQASISQSLVEMRYETVVFFLWLATEGGPGAVGDFLTRMGDGDQTAILRGLIDEAQWTAFIEAYADGRVQFPGGFAVRPPAATIADFRFTRSRTVELPTRAFTIPRWGLIFPEGKEFELTLDPPSAPPVVRMREDGTPGWSSPPDRLSTCEGERTHLIYAATTGDSAEASLTVDTDEDDTGAACCLVGKWLPTDQALQGLADFGSFYGGMALAGAGGELTCSHGGGGWTLTFDNDRTGSIDYDGYSNQCTTGQIAVVQTISGGTRFEWRITGPGAAQLRFLEHSMVQSLTAKLGPSVQELGGDYPGPATDANGMAFTCDGDRLSVTGMFNLLVEQADHTRITAP